MASSKKKRIDSLLVDRRLAEFHTKAQTLISEGRVTANGFPVEKAASLIESGAFIEVREDEGERWVSRGAYKLLKALDVFSVSPESKICVDIGASTGGFTNVLLCRGARKVYAVDVGYGQLAWSLRQNGRVAVMERTNARTLEKEHFAEPIDLAVADASFISLKLLLPPLQRILSPEGEAVLLIKPQFEVEKGKVGKGGIVRSKDMHLSVLENILSFCSTATDFQPAGLSFSPVTGQTGNIEFLLHLSRSPQRDFIPVPGQIVEEAHLFFRKD
ncbi:MAG: TlyA family RNA methyltransferase [Synergistaceae bacterium]|nr:TlyA family RNA methyltransferase [Synergistaceae bacterium]